MTTAADPPLKLVVAFEDGKFKIASAFTRMETETDSCFIIGVEPTALALLCRAYPDIPSNVFSYGPLHLYRWPEDAELMRQSEMRQSETHEEYQRAVSAVQKAQARQIANVI